MGTDLIVPEITLIEKLEEVDGAFSPTLWQQMKNDVAVLEDKTKNLPASSLIKRKMLLSDFVDKAINLPLKITPEVNRETEKQLYRLHLFCCQQAVHNLEVRHNPFVLGFRALEEVHMALVAILNAYRLIHPECPYSWDKKFLSAHVITDKKPDGQVYISFCKPLNAEIINTAITEKFVTDWLIYRAYDHAGIRTLRDIKNNLLELPNFQHGGDPISEFSRFERKIEEQNNRKTARQNEALETEFKKKLIQAAADMTVEQLVSSGASVADLLNEAFNGDLTKLMAQMGNKATKPLKEVKKEKMPSKKDTEQIENFIAGLLEDDN